MSATDATPELTAREQLLVDAIAHRMIELLDERDAQQGARPHEPLADDAHGLQATNGLVDAQTVADALGVGRSTVYEHAAELGARHVGAGARPRLRFDPEEALRAWTRRSVSEESHTAETPVATGIRQRRKPARLGSGTDLLPIKR